MPSSPSSRPAASATGRTTKTRRYPWLWKQAEACAYELPPGGTWERDLCWVVPAALVAVYDELVAGGQLRTGRAESRVVPAADPLDGLTF